MKNILFSSTRQWNPGDEVILFGFRRVMDDAGIEYNPILYNRHPLITRLGNNKMGYVFDNSFMEGTDAGLIDYMILAGTPEWTGSRMALFYRVADRANLRFSAFWIGSGPKTLEPKFRDWFLKKADVIVTRDESSRAAFSSDRVVVDSCPALFAAPSCFVRKGNVKNVGICYQTAGYCCSPNKLVKAALSRSYAALMARFNCVFVCHTYPDLVDCKKSFPDAKIRYSYDAEDYVYFYEEFDVVVGTRIHGMALAASWGIPSFYVGYDDRASTVDRFLSVRVSAEELLNSVASLDLESSSRFVVSNRTSAFHRYLGYVKAMVGAW